MSLPALPLIDGSPCLGWNPQDLRLYNRLDRWLVEREVKFRKVRGNWRKPFGSMNWQANVGPTITSVITEPPPVLRQFAFPNRLEGNPAKKDVVQFRERTTPAYLFHHKFESPVFQWLPSFQDFIKKKVTKNVDYVMKWQEDFANQFYRGVMFHQSPAVFYPDSASGEVDDTCPIGYGSADGSTGKSDAYLAAALANIGSPGNLSIRALFAALGYMEEDAKAVPYQAGSASDDNILNDKFLCMCSTEAYGNFINDPYTREMRPLATNYINEGFKGDLWGRITFSLHSDAIRVLRAGDGSISFPAPDIIQENPDAPNFGQTIRNPDYRAAQYELAFLVGAEAYDIINPGPPPADFAASGPDRISSLKWNGRPRITDRINVPCETESAGTAWEANAYDEFLRVISYMVLGIAPNTTRNVLPIFFKRSRNLTQSLI